MRLPAFLRRKSASDEKEKEEEKALPAEKKIDGLPPSAQGESPKKSAVVDGEAGGGEDATKVDIVEGAPATLAKPVLP